MGSLRSLRKKTRQTVNLEDVKITYYSYDNSGKIVTHTLSGSRPTFPCVGEIHLDYPKHEVMIWDGENWLRLAE
jgi:hypothetical protein